MAISALPLAQGHQTPSWIDNSPWIHCVKCRTYPYSDSRGDRRPFFVTDCGHVYCSQCRVIAESSRCSKCQRRGLKFLEITEDIRNHPQVGVFFQDLKEICIQLSKLFGFQENLMGTSKQYLRKGDINETSLVAQYGSMAMTPMKHLEEQWSESMKRKKLVEQKFRALSTKSNQLLMGIESIVMKFKRLSYREENILDVHANGSPVPSIKVICVSRTFLHGAARLLGAGERIQANNGSSTNTRTNSGEMQTGSGRDGGQDRVQSAQVGGMMTPQQQQHGRMVGQIVTPHQFGGQGRTQNAQLGSQPSMAGMMTPQQQHYGTMVAQIVTPHQFGLTPFQRVTTPSICSVGTPTTMPAVQTIARQYHLPPPPPPPPFSPHLSQPPPATPRMSPNQACSPMSWHTPTRAAGMPPPRLPPSRRGQAQGTSPSPSRQISGQQMGRQFLNNQSILTPLRQQHLTPQQAGRAGPARVSPSPVGHPSFSSPAASGVATGSAIGFQLTPMQCTTPTNQLIRNISHQSLQQRIMKATPSPIEMTTPQSNQSSISRPRTPMSVRSASPSSPFSTPRGASTPTNLGRVSIRGPPSGGRMGHVTKTLTPEGTPPQTPMQLCTPQRSCYSTPPMNHSGGSSNSSSGKREIQIHYT